jgi:hypothetical protein
MYVPYTIGPLVQQTCGFSKVGPGLAFGNSSSEPRLRRVREPVRAHVVSRSSGGVLMRRVSLVPGLLAARHHGLVIKVAPSISVI